MENKKEIITLHKQGRTMIIEVVEDPSRYVGQRAYISGSSQYYEMDKLATAIAACDSIERVTT